MACSSHAGPRGGSAGWRSSESSSWRTRAFRREGSRAFTTRADDRRLPIMKTPMRLVILSLLFAAHLPAQALPADSLFNRLVGRWELRGTIARQSTVHDVSFNWLLGREYVQMHEVSRERAANGSPAYEAVVMFGRDPKSGEYACLWLDNTGASAFDPIGTGRGRVAGDSIPFVFHYTPATGFHTTFVYSRKTDSWEW